MQLTVEILFVIGVFVNLIKGADLLLRPHQQKWIQSKVESLALWLDYTKPLRWYTSMVHKRMWIFLGVAAPFIVFFWPLLPLVYGSTHSIFDVGVLFLFTLLFVILGVRTALSPESELPGFLSNRPPYWSIHKLVWYWLVSSRTLTSQFFKHLLVVAVAIGLALIWVNKVSTMSDEGILRTTFYIIYLAVFVAVSWLFAASSFLIILFTLHLLLLELILKVFRGLTWRIVEYNKGAFAAIVLLVTIALGVTEFYLKYQPSSRPVQTSPSPTHTP